MDYMTSHDQRKRFLFFLHVLEIAVSVYPGTAMVFRIVELLYAWPCHRNTSRCLRNRVYVFLNGDFQACTLGHCGMLKARP